MSSPINLTSMPVLPKAEQDELAVQAKHGNHAAGRRLIESNLLLILKEMHEMYHEYNWEVFRAGVHGMDEAIDKFEIEKGHFTHYAMHYVRMRMRRERHTSRLVQVPLGTTQHLREIEQGKRENTERMQKTAAMYYRTLNVTSMDTPFYEDGQTPAEVMKAEQLDPAAEAVRSFDLAALKDAIEKLNDREQLIIRMRYGLGMEKQTLVKIAEIMGISRERVRQLQMKAQQDLRELIDPPPTPEAAPMEAIYRHDGWFIARYTDGKYWPLTSRMQPRTRVGARWKAVFNSFLMLTARQRERRLVYSEAVLNDRRSMFNEVGEN